MTDDDNQKLDETMSTSDSDIELVDTDEEGVEEFSGAKIKKLREDLKKSQAERAEYLAGWQRAKADYINLKQSTDKSQIEITKYAKEGLLVDLITLADSFDMAMANKTAWEGAPENWRKGVEYIYTQLQNIFKDNGLEAISPLGLAFNPEYHESLGVVETKEASEDGKVLEVLKKGYILQDKLIRPASVKVGQYQK